MLIELDTYQLQPISLDLRLTLEKTLRTCDPFERHSDSLLTGAVIVRHFEEEWRCVRAIEAELWSIEGVEVWRRQYVLLS